VARGVAAFGGDGRPLGRGDGGGWWADTLGCGGSASDAGRCLALRAVSGGVVPVALLQGCPVESGTRWSWTRAWGDWALVVFGCHRWCAGACRWTGCRIRLACCFLLLEICCLRYAVAAAVELRPGARCSRDWSSWVPCLVFVFLSATNQSFGPFLLDFSAPLFADGLLW